jgi:hypothetical protein
MNMQKNVNKMLTATNSKMSLGIVPHLNARISSNTIITVEASTGPFSKPSHSRNMLKKINGKTKIPKMNCMLLPPGFLYCYSHAGFAQRDIARLRDCCGASAIHVGADYRSEQRNIGRAVKREPGHVPANERVVRLLAIAYQFRYCGNSAIDLKKQKVLSETRQTIALRQSPA